MRRRRAFTLVELSIMSALALVLAVVIWNVFSSLMRQGQKLDVRMRALQASQILLENIQADLKSYYNVPSLVLTDPTLPGGESYRLSFYVFSDYTYQPSEADQASIQCEPVIYAFDPATHAVKRNGEPMRFARFESVTFRAKHSDLPRDPDNAITVRIGYVAEEVLDDPARLADAPRVSYSASISLTDVSLSEASTIWQDNPFDRMIPIH